MGRIEHKYFKAKNGYNVLIRDAGINDAANIIDIKKSVVMESVFMLREIEETNYSIEEEKKIIENHLKNSGSLFIVAEIEKKVLGLLEFENGPFKKTCHAGIFTMFILKEWREIGIGNLLLKTLIVWAEKNPILKKITLAVFSTNERALNLYKKFGFIEEGRCPKDMRLKDGTYIDSVLMYKFVK